MPLYGIWYHGILIIFSVHCYSVILGHDLFYHIRPIILQYRYCWFLACPKIYCTSWHVFGFVSTLKWLRNYSWSSRTISIIRDNFRVLLKQLFDSGVAENKTSMVDIHVYCLIMRNLTWSSCFMETSGYKPRISPTSYHTHWPSCERVAIVMATK